MPRVYRTEEAAINHVFVLAASYGMWPGIVRTDRGWVLTAEPDETAMLALTGEPGDDAELDDSEDGPWHD